METWIREIQKQKDDNERKFKKLFGNRRLLLDDNYFIIKIKATERGEGIEQFKEIFDVNPLQEKTFVYGDDDNNIYLCYSRYREIPDMNLTDKVSVVKSVKLDVNGVVRKSFSPTVVPKYIKKTIKLEGKVISKQGYIEDEFVDKINNLGVSDHAEFFEGNFQRGRVYNLKDIRKNKKWKCEYEKHCHIKRVNICKSCEQKAKGGKNKCCEKYHEKNRKALLTIVNWEI